MQAFINFMRDNWQFIGSGLVLVLQLLILFIKRRKPEIMGDGVLDLVEHLVEKAESIFGAKSGEDKLQYVIKNVKKTYPTATDSAIKSRVEYLLSLPQKKGVKNV